MISPRGGTAQGSAPQHGPRPLPLFLRMLHDQTAGDADRRAAALKGLHAYQTAPRARPTRPMPARFRRGSARLRDYGGAGPAVVFVPSLINPPVILDLTPATSLLRHVAAGGHRTWLVDWGTPTLRQRDLDIAGHVEHVLLPLLSKLPEPPLLVGYCLGGTIALAAAALMPVAGVATIAAPWRFAGYGDARAAMADLWAAAEPACEALGLVPMEVLQSGFWQLDPARTIAKYARFGAVTPGSDAAHAFVALEDWANAGAPLTLAAGRDLFTTFLRDDAPGEGRWCAGWMVINPARLACPTIEFVSTTDRIVPAATAAGLPHRHDVAAGHVGMIVGGHARPTLWAPLVRWLGNAAKGC